MLEISKASTIPVFLYSIPPRQVASAPSGSKDNRASVRGNRLCDEGSSDGRDGGGAQGVHSMKEVDENRPADIGSGSIRRRTFLRDVLICSLGAYGGPEAHMGVFVDQMVTKKRYLTEDELVELMALCSILPGPTSTQTIVSIGYKTGGPLLALLTMLVWALPVLVAMTLLSFLYQGLATWNVSTEVLRFIGPMAVGFIVVAAFRIGRKVVRDVPTGLLLAGGALTTYWIRAPWIFPVVLLAGGAVAMGLFREPGMWNRPRLLPPWRYLGLFASFALGLLALSYFVYPVWEQLKAIRAIRIALRGINAVAGGLIAIAAVILMQASGFRAENLVVTALSIALLASRMVPAPLIVVGALAAGFMK